LALFSVEYSSGRCTTSDRWSVLWWEAPVHDTRRGHCPGSQPTSRRYRAGRVWRICAWKSAQLNRSASAGTAFGCGPDGLSKLRRCVTLYDMKTSALTIRLDPELDRQLDRLAKRSGRSRSEIARDALRRQLAVLQLEEARKQILPFAEARGYLTDEDVFREIS
jgi:predicted transcriptional regulator